MKVALVHDWLTNYGGSEKCIEAIHFIFKDAPIYTTVFNPKNMPVNFKDMDIKTSFIQKLPWAKTKYQNYLPLMPLAFEEFDLSEFDLVISNSHSCAKGVRTLPNTLHISYVQTPMRYAWDLYNEYMKQNKSYLSKLIIRPILSYLRMWDRLSADRVEHFICNSYNVQERIRKYYKREAEIIYPPVDTDFFKPSYQDHDGYFLVISRLVSYKRIDLIIETFNKLNLPLKIVGTGGEFKSLKRKARSNIEFLGYQPDEKLKELYANCQAFIFAAEEDFGITPVEAQSAGRPVVAYGFGGTRETVIENKTGIFFYEQSIEALASAVHRLRTMKFNCEEIRNNALKFDKKIFFKKFKDFVLNKYEEFKKNKKLERIYLVT